MSFAFAEMRRSRARFGLIVAAVAVLAFLILAQQAVRDSLLDSFVGGIRSQSAEVLVFNVDGRRFLQGSTIVPALESLVRDVEGADVVGRIWQGTYAAEADGEVGAVAVVGYDVEGAGSPGRVVEGRLPRRPGEVVANAADADLGFDVGDDLRVEPGGLVLTVVGLAADAGLNVSPTVWTTEGTYADVARTRNPELVGDITPNALGVRPEAGVGPDVLADRINGLDADLDALTAPAAADENPGVVSIRRSFGVIFALIAAVVPLVIGLFFTIITAQKAPTLMVLQAAGAPAGRLVAGVVTQVVVVVAAGLALAAGGYALLARQRIDGLAVGFDVGAVLTWSAVLGTLGCLSAFASVRRVLAVEPAAALSGGGDR